VLNQILCGVYGWLSYPESRYRGEGALVFKEELMPAKRYKVTLADEERQALFALISKGNASAHKLTRARILLQADQSPQGPSWSDQQIHQALHVGRLTVERTRQALVEHGIEAALSRKKRSTPGNQKFDGAKEAHLIAMACSEPPTGCKRWTLQLLADKMIEMAHFDSISAETIRQHLKKTNLSHG
jgi:Homeodomain-like domain